ncbi:Mg-dependent DNase [Aureobasidium sp. EXF-10728]|nr:Mg-dependent DNase [Aureobasidium sp. EXF-10728]
MGESLLKGFPEAAPAKPSEGLIYADVAVTATAKEFAGIYRGKQYHEPDFDSVLDRAATANVKKILLTGMSAADIEFNAQIARAHASHCSITIGIHPYHASLPYENGSDGKDYFSSMANKINELLDSSPGLVAAYGELGLDYDHLGLATRETQLRCFEDQLPRRGLVHSFVGSRTQMQKLVDMGLDVSVNGFSFKDRESLEMVAAVPLYALQLETDAPWGIIQTGSEVAKRYLVNAPSLPASKKKDKFAVGNMIKERNESCCMSQVAFIVAGLKGISVEEVTRAAWENSVKIFWT